MDLKQDTKFLYYQPRWKARTRVKQFACALLIGTTTLSLSHIYTKTHQGWTREAVLNTHNRQGHRDYYALGTTVFVTASGTWVVPANVYNLSTVDCIGGGGNSGAGNTGATGTGAIGAGSGGVGGAGGAGGGGGGWARKSNVAVTPGSSLSVTVGAAQGTTSFAGVCSATGGSGASPGGGAVGDVGASGGSGAGGAGGGPGNSPTAGTGGTGGNGGGGGGAAGPSGAGGSAAGAGGGAAAAGAGGGGGGLDGVGGNGGDFGSGVGTGGGAGAGGGSAGGATLAAGTAGRTGRQGGYYGGGSSGGGGGGGGGGKGGVGGGGGAAVAGSQGIICINYLVAPTLTAISPSVGPASGGTTVTLTGTSFDRGISSVKFGATNAASFAYVNSTTATCVSPAGTGTANIIVTTIDGATTASGANLFTWLAASAGGNLAMLGF